MNFDMGAYGAYIWPAYGISAIALKANACVRIIGTNKFRFI